ncbi:glycosyltransferase [Bacillus sp. P14.5]|uniref:glycosyltransferase n=1 Tax=Bacillus sp. P14.5 TaxID=1983400 RepID=UPI000DE8B2F2|nr:glycosyltransferase [Bacillus sp. P14.5]
MKRVAQFIPSLSIGGAEKVAANLSVSLSNEKYEKYIIVFNNNVTNTYNYNSSLINLRVNFKKGKIGKVITLIELFIKLLVVKRKYKFDTVISHLPLLDLLNSLTKRKNEKVITTIHNNIEEDYSRNMKGLLRFIVKKSSYVVAVSKVGEAYVKEKLKINNEKVLTINNFNDNTRIQGLAKEDIEARYLSIFNRKVLINIGRLENQKGHYHLLKIFSEIKKVHDVNLLILGQGSLEAELKEFAIKLGIQENVHFLGFQSNPYKFLFRSDLFVSTSLYEGYPMTLIESMSLGVPVISTDCISGPREILAPSVDLMKKLDYEEIIMEYGFLGNPMEVKPPNFHDRILSQEEKSFANQISEILSNPDLLMKYSALALKRSEFFDKDYLIKKWENLID